MSEIEIKSVQIIKIEGSTFVFNYEVFQDIIKQNKHCQDLPVAVIIINGALKTGKSFFSNFIIRHLKQYEEKSNNIHNEIKNDSNSDSLSTQNMLRDYFTSRRGPDIQTLGVWALNRIFIHDEKAIILMDTQGIFDQELNQAMTIALISLSTIVSSYQIYNLDKRIQEDHLCNMAYFSAYSSLLSNVNNTKIGQTLCLLVRDWQNYENNYDLQRCDMEAEQYMKNFLFDYSMSDTAKVDTRKKIFDTYDSVDVKLCPHPGYIVTEGKFSGDLSEIREDFRIHVEHIIDQILASVEPKRISSNQTLLCRELPMYLNQYVQLYQNVKDSLPKAMTILETTEKICQQNARTKTVHYYRDKMNNRMKTKTMSKDDIEAWHNSCLRDAISYFNKLYIMGREDDVKNIRITTMSDIDLEYNQFLLMAREKNIINIALNAVLDFLKHVDINFDILSEMFIKNAFIVLSICYVLTIFMPYGGEYVATLIRYVICIIAGMYFYMQLVLNKTLSKDVKNIEVKVDNEINLIKYDERNKVIEMYSDTFKHSEYSLDENKDENKSKNENKLFESIKLP